MNKEEILEIIKNNNIDNCYLFATFYNKFRIGYYDKNEINFIDEVNYDMLTEIKLFNKDLELRIYKENDRLISKLINDNMYKDYLEDEYMFINGNEIVDKNDDFTTIRQDMGSISLPIKLTENEVKDGVRLRVRNYIDVDKNNQVVRVDSRYVDICVGEDN